MKMRSVLPLLAAITFCAGACQKQETEAERSARIEQEVQQRVASERQGDAQQQLDARQAELDARERALAEQENRPVETAAPIVSQSTPATVTTTTTTTAEAEDSDDLSYGTFYRKLDPYGDWMDTGDYGYVFQPRQAASSTTWRPYTNGHWVYTDAGWTWISDEKFGWATYHYGRWVRLRSVGWVWVPGEEWAPAWVSWRRGGDYVGWAPLPPEAQFDRGIGIHKWADNYYDIGPDQYAFVPANEFGRKLSPREILPTERNVTIINQTTNVTNIVYNNSVIVDRGPSYDDLRSRSRQPIERYRLERTTTFSNETPVFRGEVVAVPTVNFRPTAEQKRPTRVVKTIAQPVVERGWNTIKDTQAAQKARTKMAAEATPPPNLPPKKFVKPKPAKPAPRAASTPIPVSTPRPTAKPASTPVATPVPGRSAPPRRHTPAPAQIKPIATAAPAATAAPTRPPAPKTAPTAPPNDAMQPSPAENVVTPKGAGRNPRQQALQEKRKQQQEAQAQRQAERQQMRENRQKQEFPAATPDATPVEVPPTTPGRPDAPATPSPSPTEPSPSASASATPSPAERQTKAERRQAKQAERRQAKKAERRAKRNGGELDDSPSPTPIQP